MRNKLVIQKLKTIAFWHIIYKGFVIYKVFHFRSTPLFIDIIP